MAIGIASTSSSSNETFVYLFGRLSFYNRSMGPDDHCDPHPSGEEVLSGEDEVLQEISRALGGEILPSPYGVFALLGREVEA